MDRKLGTNAFRTEAVVAVVSMSRIKMNGLPFFIFFF
jgi:hypothetical protein